MKTLLVVLSIAALSLGAFVLFGGRVSFNPSPVEAIPPAQRTCQGDTLAFTTAEGWVGASAPVTINNGTAAREVIAQFTSDAAVNAAAMIRVGYRIDGGAVQEGVFGPAMFAKYLELWETRTTFAVMRVAAGVHTVQPMVRISGAAGMSGHLMMRCFTVEGRTK